jgi:hypothetical protein
MLKRQVLSSSSSLRSSHPALVVPAGGRHKWAAPVGGAGGRCRCPAGQIALPCSMWQRRRWIDARVQSAEGYKLQTSYGQIEVRRVPVTMLDNKWMKDVTDVDIKSQGLNRPFQKFRDELDTLPKV